MIATTEARARLRAILLSTVLAPALLVSAPSLAQTQTEASDTKLDEIVVTGRLREEALQTVPLAISAFNEARVEAAIADTIVDFQKFLPNVQLSDVNFSGNTLAVSIRGISFADLEKSFENAIGVSIDGVFLGTNTGAAFEISDVESIEVLRGPQGTLQGRNTIGGAINIRRTRPTGELGMKVNLRYARYDNIDASFVINTNKIGDALSFKFFGTYKEGDSHTFNRTLNRRDEGKDYFSGGMAIAVQPEGSTWEGLITVEYMDDNSRFPSAVNLTKPNLNQTVYNTIRGTVPPAAWFGATLGRGGTLCDAVIVAFGSENACDTRSLVPIQAAGFNVGFQPIPFENTMEQWAATVEINGELGGAKFKSVTGYRDSSELLREENTGAPPIPLPLPTGTIQVPLFVAVRDTIYNQFSQEFNLNFNPTDFADVVAGVYYMRTNYTLRPGLFNGQTALAFLLGGPAQSGGASQVLNSYAVFAEAIWNLTPTVRLTTGARYTHEKKNFNVFQTTAPVFNVTSEESWSKLTGRALLDWQLNDDVLLYGGWSRGFRSGGFNGRAASELAARTSYDPETVDSFEIGAKTSWFDGRMTFNPTFFYAKYKDVQQDIIVPAPGGQGTNTFVENAGAARIYGAEAELQARVLDNLTVNAAVGFLDAKYTRFEVFDAALGRRVDVKDQRQWRRSPDITFSVGANYTHPIGPGELLLNTNLSYIDDFATSPVRDAFAREIIVAQTKFDISLGYQQEQLGVVKDFSIKAYGKDILAGKDGRLNTTLNAGIFFFGVQVPARTFGVETSFSF
jgi:iron complex outermembrane receptor protein